MSQHIKETSLYYSTVTIQHMGENLAVNRFGLSSCWLLAIYIYVCYKIYMFSDVRCHFFSILDLITSLSDDLWIRNRTISGLWAQDLIVPPTTTSELKMGEILVPIIDLWVFSTLNEATQIQNPVCATVSLFFWVRLSLIAFVAALWSWVCHPQPCSFGYEDINNAVCAALVLWSQTII